MLDTAAALPLYHQLAEALFAQIRAGKYVPGEKIPSEHELAAHYRVGRPTVRQATDTLIQRGVLERKRGSGTFVRSVPAQVDLFSLAGTLMSFEQQGLSVRSELLDRAYTGTIAEAGHPLDGRTCVHFSRLSRVDGAPVLLEEFAFDGERFPGLGRIPLRGRSISRVIEEHFALRPQSAEQTFRVVPLDARRAELLALQPAAAILRVDRTLHFVLAPGAVFVRMYCRTDRFAFSQRIEGKNHG